MIISDLKKYICHRQAQYPAFNDSYDEGYPAFKIGAMFRQAREASGLTQDDIAQRLNTQNSAISRIANHAEDIKLSTLAKFAAVLGRQLEVSIT